VAQFGGRNPELQVLDKTNGTLKWRYIEKDGGWISGDPVVKNDTLYIGGSDNHEMFAFNVFTGEKYWEYLFLNNTFTKPVLYKNYLFFTTGDAYSVFGSSNGRGYLYALERKNGNIKNVAFFNGNIHSSPVVINDVIFLTSEDHTLYAIDANEFINMESDLKVSGYNAIDSLKVSPTSFSDSVQIDYQVNYKTRILVKITNLDENEIKEIESGIKPKGEYSIIWSGKDNSGKKVGDGNYFVEISSGDFYLKTFVQKQ